MAPLFVFGILKCGIPHNSSLHVPSSFLYIFFYFFDLFFLSVPSITCVCLTSESIALHLRAFFFMVQHHIKLRDLEITPSFYLKRKKSKIRSNSLSPFLNPTSTFPPQTLDSIFKSPFLFCLKILFKCPFKTSYSSCHVCYFSVKCCCN